MNILDIPEDVLSKIGNIVKKDNITRMEKEKEREEEQKEKDFKYVDTLIKQLKKEFNIRDRPSIREYIYKFFYTIDIYDNDPVIDEYLKLKKLNLKRGQTIYIREY